MANMLPCTHTPCWQSPHGHDPRASFSWRGPWRISFLVSGPWTYKVFPLSFLLPPEAYGESPHRPWEPLFLWWTWSRGKVKVLSEAHTHSMALIREDLSVFIANNVLPCIWFSWEPDEWLPSGLEVQGPFFLNFVQSAGYLGKWLGIYIL